MTNLNRPQVIISLIFLFFLAVFIFKSAVTMSTIPFFDFDEAHRAENAKRMKEYGSLFVPLTGSPYDRVESLKIPLKENPYLYLYYHLERPPLVYDLMILSTSIFGQFEWAYRLPSFLFGVGIIGIFFYFAKKEKNRSIFALAVGLLTLITSKDLWLSAQYAQMDTGLSFLLFLSLITLIFFCDRRKAILVFLSGGFFGMAMLSKLQPAVIFIFPLLYLLLTKKLLIKDLLGFLLGFALIFLPWLAYLTIRFGFKDVINIMPGFALTSASIIDINHKAPLFWYARWWWESFRPGWVIFLALFVYDLLNFSLSWKKLTLLSYIIFGLLAFSLPANKLWWYILPFVPAVAYYTFLSVNDYLNQNPKKINNLFLVVILASLPIFMQMSNTIGILYGITITAVSYFIIKAKESLINRRVISRNALIYLAIIISLVLFYVYFPAIIPYHWNTKAVALFYKNLPGQKCLFIGDMPTEAALFYSDAGEILPIQVKDHTPVFLNCANNYLITPERYKYGEPVFRQGSIRLYKLEK